jgi:uncharacterized membrane protein YheB (UPF0754 family)
MITSEEILKRLQKGESPEDIGNEFATILNAANAKYQKENNNKARKAALVSILSELLDWYEAWYDEVGQDYDVHDLADAVIEAIDNFKSISELLNTNLINFNKPLETKDTKPQKNTMFEKDLDDIVRMFICD